MGTTATKAKIEAETLYWSSTSSARGLCTVIATEKGVCWMGTPGTSREEGLRLLKRHLSIADMLEGEAVAPLSQAMDELRRYLAGERLQFACPLDLRGTPFQVAVWEALYRIPYGQTRSYAQIAQAVGSPKAVRAVGMANGANPVAVIVPCHRVIGSNGTLTGYGGGLPMKQWLLALEGVTLSM
jgi:O-6-methylguanine DNA methyltransferase